MYEFEYDAPSLGAQLRITSSIATKSALLDAFAAAFSFPEYFGKNWDALIDMMSDLSWLEANAVVMHESLPSLSEEELRSYVRCLKHVLDRFRERGNARARFLFRITDRAHIERLL